MSVSVNTRRLYQASLKGCPDPDSTLQEMKNLFPTTGCLSISHRLSVNLADQESCVIVGKCADYVLKGQKKCGQHLYRSSTCLLSGPYHAADESICGCGSMPPSSIQISTERTIINIIQKEITGPIPSITI